MTIASMNAFELRLSSFELGLVALLLTASVLAYALRKKPNYPPGTFYSI